MSPRRSPENPRTQTQGAPISASRAITKMTPEKEARTQIAVTQVTPLLAKTQQKIDAIVTQDSYSIYPAPQEVIDWANQQLGLTEREAQMLFGLCRERPCLIAPNPQHPFIKRPDGSSPVMDFLKEVKPTNNSKETTSIVKKRFIFDLRGVKNLVTLPARFLVGIPTLQFKDGNPVVSPVDIIASGTSLETIPEKVMFSGLADLSKTHLHSIGKGVVFCKDVDLRETFLQPKAMRPYQFPAIDPSVIVKGVCHLTGLSLPRNEVPAGIKNQNWGDGPDGDRMRTEVMAARSA